MRSLLLLAPLAWLLLAQAKDDAKLEGEDVATELCLAILRRGPGCPGDLGWKGGGAGLRSSVHLSAGDSDRSLPLLGSGFLDLCCGQRRGRPKYTSHSRAPYPPHLALRITIPLISSKTPVYRT